jgi:hypothetical protein
MRRVVEESVHAAVLLAVTGVAAVASGSPFLFPSLGPTAYVLATVTDRARVAPRRVIGGHAVGVVAGLVAYHTLAPGLVVTVNLGVQTVPTVFDGVVILLAVTLLVVADAALEYLSDTATIRR